MTNPQLHKTLIAQQDQYRFLRAIYSDDKDLLATFNNNAAAALDACVASVLNSLSPADKLFKVEMTDGTLAGYILLKDQIQLGLYLRPSFRKLSGPFIALINEIIANAFYTSTGSNNYNAIAELLKDNFKIQASSFDFNGKSLVFLKP